MHNVALTLNSTHRLTGWQEINITLSMDNLAGSFELQFSDRYGDDDKYRVTPGDRCTVSVDGETLITGYVFEAMPSYDASTHSVTVRGNDAAGDLVDCSAMHKGGEWTNATLVQIADDLTLPFDVEVRPLVDVGAPFRKFSIQQGETVFEALDRAARFRGVMLMSDGQGGLLITRAGINNSVLPTALAPGENVLSAQAHLSWRERYSQYTVKGEGIGDDESWGAAVTQQAGYALDKSVDRYRPLVILAEENGHAQSFGERAVWQRNVRAGRSARVTYTVQGWYHDAGLWMPNRLVPVRDPLLHLAGDMLITAVKYRRSRDGARAELSLMRPDAYDRITLPPPQTVDDRQWLTEQVFGDGS